MKVAFYVQSVHDDYLVSLLIGLGTLCFPKKLLQVLHFGTEVRSSRKAMAFFVRNASIGLAACLFSQGCNFGFSVSVTMLNATLIFKVDVWIDL